MPSNVTFVNFAVPPRPLHAIAAHLISQGGHPWLFERLAAPSLLVERPALTIRFEAGEVRLQPHTPAGHALLASLPDAQLVRTGRRAYPRPFGHDLEARLLAPGPFDVLRLLVGPGRAPLALGILAFDHVQLFEDLPPPPPDLTGFPEAHFLIPDRWFTRSPEDMLEAHALGGPADAEELAALAVAAPDLPPAPTAAPADATTDLSDTDFCRLVETCQAHVAAGDVFQIVPSRSFAVPCPDPFHAYRRLYAADPAPYRFYAPGPGWTLFGASPESAVRVSVDREVEIRPIAGTRPRGRDPAEDAVFAAQLLADEKELAEHRMLVDLARNDVARVSVPGTRRVHDGMNIQRAARVMHIVSTVTGDLKPELDALHALQACLNAGTLSGAPKLRATELLRQLEISRRGPYGGAIGVFGADGSLDTAIVIRSALVVDAMATARAGAGVVYDSVPQAEADETRRKASAVLSALGVAM
jgi:anthranilate synthase component 1